MKIETIIDPANRCSDGLADIRVRHESGDEYQLDLPIHDLYRRCGVPSAVALDLLIVASVCYIADKTISRAGNDGWTRHFEISFPVANEHLWNVVSLKLAATLGFLTGDIWEFQFHTAVAPAFQATNGKPVPIVFPVGAVSLFSGGLDSLAGAVDLLSSSGDAKILLVGHYDSGGPRKTQGDLATRLKNSYPNRVEIEHVRVAHRPSKGVEETLRSRSFVFMAMGLYAAQASGPDIPLYAFENGLIALNVPLTPSRMGSCSTRTMHPYYLNGLRGAIADLGITNPLLNPFALKTKGECVTECANRSLLLDMAATSVSCSHWSRRQDWKRKKANNCGYCVPCIFRRAALNAANADRGEAYGLDVKSGELTIEDSGESADDLRAVTDFLLQPVTTEAVRKRVIASAIFPDLDAHVAMACRGFQEVRAWLAVENVIAEHA